MQVSFGSLGWLSTYKSVMTSLSIQSNLCVNQYYRYCRTVLTTWLFFRFVSQGSTEWIQEQCPPGPKGVRLLMNRMDSESLSVNFHAL